RSLVTLRNEFQEGRDRRIAEFLVNQCRYARQLPNLAALERNFKSALIGIVRQILHLRIETSIRFPTIGATKCGQSSTLCWHSFQKTIGAKTSPEGIPNICSVGQPHPLYICPQ